MPWSVCWIGNTVVLFSFINLPCCLCWWSISQIWWVARNWWFLEPLTMSRLFTCTSEIIGEVWTLNDCMTRCSDESAPTNGNFNMHASEPTKRIKMTNYWQDELVQNYVELASPSLTSKRSPKWVPPPESVFSNQSQIPFSRRSSFQR